MMSLYKLGFWCIISFCLQGKDPKTIEKKSDEILDTTNLSSLQRLLNEKDAKILELKTEVIKVIFLFNWAVVHYYK